MQTVLMVTEEDEKAQSLSSYFQKREIAVLLAKTVDEVIDYFFNRVFSLIMIDTKWLSNENHSCISSMVKAKKAPLMAISSHDDPNERLEILRLGAHAYMSYPFTFEECFEQASSLIKLHDEYKEFHPETSLMACGKDLIIDKIGRQVFLKEKEVLLTRKEFDILLLFASNPNRVFTREQLYDRIWHEDAVFNVDDVVKAHIKSIRNKLSAAETGYIQNIWGVGYRFHCR